MRAISPSSRMISQMTPAGSRPASRARSTEPSVWPERTSTPPRRARSGKMWPGVTRSSGRASRATATRMVSARSRAEMPVVIPRRASMLTVNAVCVASAVVGGHHRQRQLRHALLGQRQADEPAPLARHEVDRLGRHQIGGHRQVALVLAILVVDQDHHAAGADRLDRARDRRVALGRRWRVSGQSRTSATCRSRSRGGACGRRRPRSPPSWRPTSRSMCLAIMSASRLTASPTRLSPSLVDLERVRDQGHRERRRRRSC